MLIMLNIIHNVNKVRNVVLGGCGTWYCRASLQKKCTQYSAGVCENSHCTQPVHKFSIFEFYIYLHKVVPVQSYRHDPCQACKQACHAIRQLLSVCMFAWISSRFSGFPLLNNVSRWIGDYTINCTSTEKQWNLWNVRFQRPLCIMYSLYENI